MFNKHRVVPTVYGSLGLYLLIGEKGSIGDIDFLVEDDVMLNAWDALKRGIVGELGYHSDPAHSNEFVKGHMSLSCLGYRKITDLIDVDLSASILNIHDKAVFRNLTAEQYLKVYGIVQFDKHRRRKSKAKDMAKIDALREYMDDLRKEQQCA
jgi:hypothetical protein